MTVKVDMGSDGVRWGHMGSCKKLLDSGAEEVHTRSDGVILGRVLKR